MTKHEVKFKGNVEKLQKWKRALFEAANFSGWTLENGYVTNNTKHLFYSPVFPFSHSYVSSNCLKNQELNNVFDILNTSFSYNKIFLCLFL